jgi:tripartite-type tricarboxylate transporter receptor subunit TctC
MDYRSRLVLPLLPLFFSKAVRAQSGWPDRPVRLIVPFPAGGSTDSQGRLLAKYLSQMWNQSVIVDNRPGAGTILGSSVIAKAPTDGYTIGMVVSAHAINPFLHADLPYDTLKEFSPISQVGVQHIVLVANPSFPANNIKELIELAKAKPGSLNYASPGTGTALHLAMELLKLKAGIQITHVPYKGGAPAQQDVMGGQLPMLVDIYSASLPLLKAGKLKALGLFSPTRPSIIPNIPTIAETVPGVSTMSLVGLVAPGNTPPAIVNKISNDVIALLKNKQLSAELFEQGLDASGSTPAQFDQLIRSEMAKWEPIIKSAHISIS